MLSTLTYRLETPSVQKAVALRDQLASILTEDPDTTLIASAQARDSETYHVTAVDTEAKQVLNPKPQVEATSPEEAWAKVETATVVVTDVRASG
jgi:hypothetical protein